MKAPISDEEFIEQAWKDLQVGDINEEEEACWVLLEREVLQRQQTEQGVVYGVIDLTVEGE